MPACSTRGRPGTGEKLSVSFDQLLSCGPRHVLAVVVTIAISGCDGSGGNELPRAAVTGSVSLNGKPLQEGVISFVPIEGTPGPKTSVSITEGRFSAGAAQGPVVGTHRIEIQSTDDGGYAMDDEEAFQKLRQAGVRRIEVVRVPPIYNSRSTLTEIVTAEGPNEFTFELVTGKHR